MATRPAPASKPAAWAANRISGALGRAGYGPTPAQIDDVAGKGWPAWVEAQLHPDEAADRGVHERLKVHTLQIRYATTEKYPGMDEMRPLGLIDQPIEAAWPIYVKRQENDGAERRRPYVETVSATILRAVHSRWQLREVLVNFWHDHFNVDATGNEAVAVALPTYDRDVIRRHALGNFREFLEAVSTSTAMLYYLSNRSSRAGSANENYARELFELHTLGRDAYYNDRYNRWRDVPGALKGEPLGYIDQDVYEAARALTGWTVEDGSAIDNQRSLPATGRFAYVEAWHDGYQKRVLGREIDPFQPPMADGRYVLDLVARHPATARFVTTKLCRRLIGEHVSEPLLKAAAKAWTEHADAPDQIARVVRLILLSPDFAAADGARLRRPLNLVAAFARGLEIDLMPTEALANEMSNAGQRLFGYGPPTGLPDERAYFISTNAMRRRWILVLGIAENWWKTGAFTPSKRLGREVTTASAVNTYLAGLLGAPDPTTAAAVIDGLGWPPDEPVADAENPAEIEKRLVRLAALCGMSPAFQAA